MEQGHVAGHSGQGACSPEQWVSKGPPLWHEESCAARLRNVKRWSCPGTPVSASQQCWYRHCRLVGHEEQDFRIYDEEVNGKGDLNSPRTPLSRGDSPHKRRDGSQSGSAGRGRGQLICYNCGSVGHFAKDFLQQSYRYCR